MFSQTVEYALRAMASLASHPDNQFCPAPRIAEVAQIPASYLSKVLKHLVDAGLLRGQRGPGGGFMLRRPASEISIWDVVEAVDPIRRIKTCPLDLGAHKTNLCPLHRKLDNVLADMEKAFKESTLSEMMNQPGYPQPLCDFVNSTPAPAVEGRTPLA